MTTATAPLRGPLRKRESSLWAREANDWYVEPGDIVVSGGKVGQGSTDFAWFVWLRGYDGSPEVRWLRRDV